MIKSNFANEQLLNNKEELEMAVFKCKNCGETKEGSCTPEKCPKCGAEGTMLKKETGCCSCKC
jgi:rubrerythrin